MSEMCREFDSVTYIKEILLFYEVLFYFWEKIVIDIFILDGKDYLVMIDYYSNFWGVNRLLNIKVSIIILKLKSYFVCYGMFDKVISDNRS